MAKEKVAKIIISYPRKIMLKQAEFRGRNGVFISSTDKVGKNSYVLGLSSS